MARLICLLAFLAIANAKPIEQDDVDCERIGRHLGYGIIRTHAVEHYVNDSFTPPIDMYKGIVGVQYKVAPKQQQKKNGSECAFYCQASVITDVWQEMIDSFLVKYFPMNTPRQMQCSHNGCLLEPNYFCSMVRNAGHDEF